MTIDAKPKTERKNHHASNAAKKPTGIKKQAKAPADSKKKRSRVIPPTYNSAISDIKIGAHVIKLTHQDKLYFPKSSVTKGDLIAYYKAIAPFMLPYTKGRAISMQRFPDGINREGFFQKNAGDYFPDWISTIAIKKQENGTVKYVIINNKATLVYLANQGVITPHPWLSKTDKIDYPDKMIFDLDPSGDAQFKDVQLAAITLKTFLEDKLGLPTFVMTTGSSGVHVIVPLKRKQTFDEVREFALNCAQLVKTQYPQKITVDMHKSDRGNKIFIDWLRNGFAATGVAPYAVRAKEGAPVATPLSWDELKRITSSQEYTIKTIFHYLQDHKDPWASMKKKAVSLTKSRKKLDEILSTIKKL